MRGPYEVLLVCLLLVCLLPAARAVKVTYSKTSSSQFGEYLQKSFGLAERGFIKVHYNIYPQDPSLQYDSYAMILILDDSQQNNWYGNLDGSESVVLSNINSLCNQPSTKRIPAWGEGYFNMTIDESFGSDLYSVAVLQCRVGNDANPITYDIKLHMTNARPEGEGTSHLPIQYVALGRVYSGFIIAYCLMLLGLAAQYYFSTLDGISFIQGIHHLFLITLVLKLVWVCLEYYEIFHFNQDGEDDDSLDTAVKVFNAFTTIAALATLFMLSLGWSVLRDRLTRKEANFVSACVGSFAIFEFSAAVCDESAQSCQAVSLVAFVLRSLVLLAIIIAMNFTVTQLRAMLSHSPWVPSTPLQYARCKQFQWLRLVFIIYLLLPTAYLIIQVTTFTWREEWVVVLLNELTDVLFFFHLGVTFSPLYEPLLIRAFDGSMRRTE